VNIGFVIGNGESRSNFDLRQLYSIGPIYGCNALHRELACQQLVCLDRRHLAEAMSWNCHTKSYVYTTNDMITLFKDPKLELLPKLPSSMQSRQDIASGSYATLLAASQDHSVIILFGFDFNQSKTDRVNNIYKDTDNYPRSSDPKVSSSKYIDQMNIIIKSNPQVEFVFINNDFEIPQVLLNNTNASYDTYENMLTQLLT
jgi:hypothetical protein